MAKYKSVVITVEHLNKIYACSDGVGWFMKKFPRGLKISNSQDEMNDLVASIDWTGAEDFLGYFLIETCREGDFPMIPASYDVSRLFPEEYYLFCGAGAFLSDCKFLKD